MFSTATSSIRHHRNNAIDYKIALPIIISSIITTPIGAIYSDTIPRETLRLLFALFLLFVGTNILWKTLGQIRAIRKTEMLIEEEVEEIIGETVSETKRIIISVIIGAIVGFIAGLLGVGGGSLILPFLLYFGLETKKAAGTTSFIVVFSSLLGFISKVGLTSVNLDPILAIGSYLMHFKLNKHHIKATMGIMLLLVALKILYDLF